MAQVFSPAANTVARVVLVGILVIGVLAITLAYLVQRSPYQTGEGMVITQPVPFSHEHHVAGLGIDCRYCHTSVTQSNFAGLPPTKTCMTCHSQIWTDAGLLRPVRESWATGVPIEWNRVNDLPDYVYFNHSIHIAKGVGCSTCHGNVAAMPLMYQAKPLTMGWCLNCHRHPEQYLRPLDEIYNTEWAPPNDQEERGLALIDSRNVHVAQLDNCSMCHR